MNHVVIAVSREYGSGGRAVGEEVAKRLGIAFYDKVLLQLAAERSGLSPEFLERSEEQASSSFLFNLSAATLGHNFFYQHNVPVGDKAFFAQTEVIKEVAEKESCVIVGRCAEYVLKDHPRCLKVFLHAPIEERIKWVAEKYELSVSEAKERILRIDKGRAHYYRHYTGEAWGEVEAHDLCINTAASGVEGAVEVIAALAKRM